VTDALQLPVNIAFEAQRSLAEFATLEDLCLQVIPKHHYFPDAQLASRSNQGFPLPPVGRNRVQQEYLDPPDPASAMAEKPRRNHLGVVQDHAIARPQEAGEFDKPPVFPALLIAIQDQHARILAPFQRPLCDQMFRQLVIEFG